MSGAKELSNAERRRYPRVTLPVYYRPARLRAEYSAKPLLNIGLGGLRVYSDEPLHMGERLEIELFFADNTTLTCTVKVVWIKPLNETEMAHYDVGLEFIDIEAHDLRKLARVLNSE
ncbi:PilZ domain-containing protein [Thioflexithrix psekupsensis]|uniref:PilZ domain-containing protein n=1 Tax=Thioflexithrix psekupsensis TaxID=1570016 RepID=UPI00159401A0|nr:PilZ domain-containing protein [Thioflexithrix psekupsensis]